MKKFGENKKQAQAALEYLVTYSWAFVVILASVAALTYFGAFDPDRYVRDSCEFGEQMKCVDWFVGKDSENDNTIIIRFRNHYEQEINITKIEGENMDVWTKGEIVKPGEIVRIETESDKSLSVGERVAFPMTISFKRNHPEAREHFVYGTLTTKVADNSLGLI